MTKFKIYALINPIDGNVFYVGATKNDLSVRLSQHTNDFVVHGGFMVKRVRLIQKILKKGKRPQIILLRVCTVKKVDFYEAFYYRRFKRKGCDMLQSPTRFNYTKVRRLNVANVAFESKKQSQQSLIYSP